MPFVRSDCNTDGQVNIADAIFGLSFLFSMGDDPECGDACDVNDDGQINIGDPIYQLTAQFSMGTPPPAPFPGCGPDPSADDLGCVRFTCP